MKFQLNFARLFPVVAAIAVFTLSKFSPQVQALVAPVHLDDSAGLVVWILGTIWPSALHFDPNKSIGSIFGASGSLFPDK